MAWKSATMAVAGFIRIYLMLVRRFKSTAISGTTAAIGEMLLQSQDGVIRLLPALPEAWKAGKVTGLCARGDFEVGLIWNDGRLVSATIRSNAGNTCRVSCQGKTVVLKIKKGDTVTLDGRSTFD